MYKIEVHNRINQMISLLRVTGVWQDDNRLGFRRSFLQVMQFSACVYYPIGLFGASLLSDNKIESIFMGVASIAVFVQIVRIYYFLWEKYVIIELLRTFGTHIIRKKELNQVYMHVNSKIKRFFNFASLFILLALLEVPLATIPALPFISNGKHLPLNFYFPFDWKESEIIYWFAYGFTVYSITWHCTCTILNVIIWYLMMACAMKYEILCNELKLMGGVSTKKTLASKQKMFVEQLIEFIQYHQHLQVLTEKFKTTFSNLFFIQIITSGLVICGTIFALAFVPTKNPFELLIYFAGILYIAFEIFLVTYFGNEIKLWSSRLSYCLFECDWLDQSKSCKQSMIILSEVLKRPQVLIGKLYPLDLQIFTKIMNFAYSMFVLIRFK